MPETGNPIDTCMNNNLINDCKPNSSDIKKKLESAKGSDFHSVDFNLDTLYVWKNNKSKMCTDKTNYFFV